ncbi:MAG: sulfatase-like hydrolase/transferase [Rubripirellula sp.]
MLIGRPCALLLCLLLTASCAAAERPNILWITSEDNGPQLGCYGDPYADTPNIDALAEKSLRYERCWSNAPVCAPARTTIISGMYATSLGGHHMRSGVTLPDGFQPYPEVLRSAGYYCTNNSKTDYNFAKEDGGWDESSRKAHWRGRPNKETPFFAIFNFTVSHESKIRVRPHELKHDPAKAPLPEYHPDTPEVRHDWAQYYDKMTQMDGDVGRVLRELEKDGLADSTIIFYYGDHGSGMPRSKRWPFDSGLRVPLLLHVPEQFKDLAPEDYLPGALSKRLVSFVDLGPTAISLAGAKPPENMQGVPFAGKYNGQPKAYLFGYRGRMDERIDMVRTCTDGRYVYMRHFYPDRPYLKHVDYMFQTPTTRVWKEMFDAGKLNAAQAKFWQSKPVEELFDLQSDPDEVVNLAGDEAHLDRVAKMRTVLRDWMAETLDLGLLPEAEMHRLAGTESPREYALAHKPLFQRMAKVAFEAMDPNDGFSIQELAKLAKAPESGIRFWGVRGLAIRNSDGGVRDRALQEATKDESPTVAIAACDGLLNAKDPSVQQAAITRLIELANVETVGHFASIAAMNVLDMNATLSESQRSAVSELPRQVRKPPTRVGKYVGRLIDHAVKSP